ncbi:hypothetical protein WOLCODRAFT_166107 [Wolfiporia cocos MD-104 SS10]|uniref:Malate dehydrogenase n=1 Tax=Wolfiporia cocos (strain MD-104) TaxID=742152 RepID=A0A2H3IZN6_WOLCO|nr:hypothetical protein WOLCODRAFT_166107 [Wolfiporia cocos MD-104 SS10]
MVAVSHLLSTLLAATTKFARNSDLQGRSSTADCSITSFKPSFPSNQTQLVIPTDIEPRFIGLGFGVQNYTCSSSNTYTSLGAFAELIDVSCYVNESWFGGIQNYAYNVWSNLSEVVSIAEVIDYIHSVNPPQNLAQHYFVPNPVGTGLSPKWDFTSSGEFNGNPNAYVIGRVNGTLPSPDDPTKDVTWLEVLNVQGDIADEVFRFDTVGGQPPSSCTYGSSANISVDYVSKYIFYGGSIN